MIHAHQLGFSNDMSFRVIFNILLCNTALLAEFLVERVEYEKVAVGFQPGCFAGETNQKTFARNHLTQFRAKTNRLQSESGPNTDSNNGPGRKDNGCSGRGRSNSGRKRHRGNVRAHELRIRCSPTLPRVPPNK